MGCRVADRDQLVLGVQGIVAVLAEVYAKGPNMSREDLIQEGNLELLLAADNWDEQKGPWAKYAAHVVSRRFGHMLEREATGKQKLEELLTRTGRREEDPAEVIERRDWTEHLLSQLTAVQRAAVWGRCQGYTCEEMATTRGVGARAIQDAYSQGIARLRQLAG